MLEQFLRKQKILTKFKKAYKIAGFTSNQETVEMYLEEQSTHPNAISNAFTWNETQEKSRYWVNINISWQYYLTSKGA